MSRSNHRFPLVEIMENMKQYTLDMNKRMLKAQKVLSGNLETSIASTPYEVEYQEDRVQLKHYQSERGSGYNFPLLVVYALINRETMLDLQPDRSVVKKLLDSGVDLYMLDWGYPSQKDRFLGFDEHINGYIHNAVQYILDKHGLEKLNLMGICMGGTMCAIYAAQHPEKVKNLVLTVSPTDFDTDTGLLHVWWGNKGFDVDRLVDLQGNVSGDMLNINFLLMNPARLMLDKYVNFMEHMDNRKFVENFLRMEKWIFDSPDVPGEIFREFIKECYQENKLINNRLEVGAQRVDLGKITMPVLNIYALYDHLVPPASCETITKKVGSKDAEDFAIKTGHIGIYVSSKSQKEFAPKICSWLKKRDAVPKKTAKIRSSKAQSPKRTTRNKVRSSVQ